MPANVEELNEYIEQHGNSGWAKKLAQELGDSLLYGPQYKRGAWDNFVDAVKFNERKDTGAAAICRAKARYFAEIIGEKECHTTIRDITRALND